MSSTSITATGNANYGSAQTCGRDRISIRFTQAVLRKAHSLFRTKIPVELAVLAKCKPRTVEYWSDSKDPRPMDLDDLLNILGSGEAISIDVMQVFWDHIPEITRERWLKQELLNRRLAAVERKKKAAGDEADQIRQLRFELNKR